MRKLFNDCILILYSKLHEICLAATKNKQKKYRSQIMFYGIETKSDLTDRNLILFIVTDITKLEHKP